MRALLLVMLIAAATAAAEKQNRPYQPDTAKKEKAPISVHQTGLDVGPNAPMLVRPVPKKGWDLAELVRLSRLNDFPFSLCPGAPSDLSISKVQVTPDPPVAGQNITIWAYGAVDEEMTDGSQVVIAVDFMGVQIFSESLPMSDVTQMPAGPGPIEIHYAIDIPGGVPHGPYSVSLTFDDQTGTELTCLIVQFSL